jgi:predicted ATPase
MLRELAEALNVLTAARPLVLVLEDLHWSDYATLDALAALARRREPARLLLLGTYRPPDALQRGHPLQTVQHELHMHGQCAELTLLLLSEAAVETYLATRFPDTQLPAGLAHLVHQRTEGNPLFMVQVVEDWVRRGWLAQVDGRWTLRVGLAALAVTVPEGLRQMLEQQLARLSPMEQQMIEAGSVAGSTFSAAAVAAGLAHEVVRVEECCTGLSQRRQWLEACGEQSWPDGTVAGAYGFTHALYQEVAYTRLTAARRAQIHRHIGEREEVGYGPQAHELAAVLAVHFERGRDADRAIRYLQHAADNALRRFAYTDAITHLTKALALLTALPETPERAQREMVLQTTLGPALIATRGYAAPEVEQTYARARTLCEQVGETSQVFSMLRGLAAFYQHRGALLTARELREQCLRLAQRADEPAHLLEAHIHLGLTLSLLGEYAAARTHLEQGSALSDLIVQPALAKRQSIIMPRVACQVYAVPTRWCLGYPAQALGRSQEALALAQELAHPYSLAMARHSAAFLHYLRRDAAAVQAEADALLTLATMQGFPYWKVAGGVWQGWALAMQGEGEVGLAQLCQGLAAMVALEEELARPIFLVLLAEAAEHVGQIEAGLCRLAEALTAFEATGGGALLAEAYRFQGEFLLRQVVPDVAHAESCFQQALAVARRQQAKSWELRAATSLSRLWQQQGKRMEAHALLAPVYGWFTEGFDTADLQEAKALLKHLKG